MSLIKLIQGEAVNITLTVTDNGAVQDLSMATLTATLSRQGISTVSLTIADASMDKSQASLGVVDVPLSAVQTAGLLKGVYVLELTTALNGLVDKNRDTLIAIS